MTLWVFDSSVPASVFSFLSVYQVHLSANCCSKGAFWKLWWNIRLISAWPKSLNKQNALFVLCPYDKTLKLEFFLLCIYVAKPCISSFVAEKLLMRNSAVMQAEHCHSTAHLTLTGSCPLSPLSLLRPTLCSPCWVSVTPMSPALVSWWVLWHWKR